MALKDQLVDLWQVEEASGNRVGVHAGLILAPNGSPGNAPGKIGQALQCVPASLQYLAAPDSPPLSVGTSDYTFCCWVNFGSTAHHSLISKGTTDLVAQAEYLLYRWTDGKIYTHAGNGTTGPNVGSGVLSNSTWYFVSTWRSSADGKLYLQIDNGTPVSVSVTGGLDNAAEFRIGRSSSGTPGYMNGLIDQVGFWKRVLAAQELTALYNGGSGLPFSQWSGTYTLSASAAAGVATGSGAGLAVTAPVYALSGSASAGVAAGSGAGLAVTPPVYSLSGSAAADAAGGSGAGLAVTAPVYSLFGSATPQDAIGSGVGLATLIPFGPSAGTGQRRYTVAPETRRATA